MIWLSYSTIQRLDSEIKKEKWEKFDSCSVSYPESLFPLTNGQ